MLPENRLGAAWSLEPGAWGLGPGPWVPESLGQSELHTVGMQAMAT